jgi:hypothetical protein
MWLEWASFTPRGFLIMIEYLRVCVFLLDGFLKFCFNFRCRQQLVYFFT